MNDGYACTGTVVAPTLILTAAHCVQDVVTGKRTPLGRYIVVTGSSDLRDKNVRQLSKVRRAVVYPGFDRFKLHGDAALLELATTTTMPAIALAEASDTALLGAGLPTYIAGWGSAAVWAPRSKRWSCAERAPSCSAASTAATTRGSTTPSSTSLSQLCTITAPSFNSGTCHGDSGGPALAFRADGTPVQIGITSLGPANCDTRLPDVYTRADLIAPWVSEWVASTAPPAPVAG